MNIARLIGMCDVGKAVEGDVLLSSSDGWIGDAIQFFTAQRETHAQQIFRGDAEDWMLAESTLDLEGGRLVANGPQITPLVEALRGSTATYWLYRWRAPPFPSQVAAMRAAWQKMIDRQTPYGVGQILLLAHWMRLRRWWGWLPWFGKWLRAHPPIPMFRQEVCSTALAKVALGAGMVKHLMSDPAGVTPGDIAAWPELDGGTELE